MIFCCLSAGLRPDVYPTCTSIRNLVPLPPLTLYFYFRIISNMIRASPYSSTMQSYSANVTTSLSFRERPYASCRGQSTCRISPANFTVLSDVLKTQYSIEETFCLLPYRYFNEFLVLYPDFSGSRQTDLLRFPFSPWSLTPLTSTDYSRTSGVYYVSHKDSAFDLFIMIHHTALLTVSVSISRITS